MSNRRRELDEPEVFNEGEEAIASEVTAAIQGDGYAIVTQHSDPWAVMDAWDDDVILRELKGEHPTGKLSYSFRNAGKTVVGLGKEGVDFCCLLMLRQGQVIRELDLQYEIRGEGLEREAYFRAKAGRFAVSSSGQEMMLDTVVGTKRQPFFNGHGVLNDHWFEHGSMKALRNARLRLIPPLLREKVIEVSSHTGRQQVAEAAPNPSQVPASDAQIKLYASLLASHTVSPQERARGLEWISKKHSMKAVQQQLDSLQAVIAARGEDEKRLKEVAK